jgi:Ca2+-binding EF-hand superfamily protein
VVGTRAVRLRDSETQHLVARIRTDEGRNQVVDLGPRERAQQRLSLREGDRIRVRGRTATVQDRQLLLASSVQTDEGSFTIPRNQQRQQQQRQAGSRSDRVQGRATQQFIEQHDENGDGRISRSELPEGMREQFEQLDRNGDSRLSQSELAQHAARMTARLVPLEVTYIWFTDANRGHIDLNDLQQAYKLLQQIDENSDGELAQNELRERREQVVSQWIDSLLERCDENSNDTISQQEARGTLLGQQFDQFDRNSDGQLSRRELRQFADRDGESYVSEGEARRRQQEQQRQ